jgi:thiol:disulfide interchange protein DsbA
MVRLMMGLFALAVVLAQSATAAPRWVEGADYVRLATPQHTTVPAGKVEVMEVFSYGCPGCNAFQPSVERLKHDLPANAQMSFLPASFRPDENFPMLQRAYFTAQALGIADRTHQAIYDAVWKTGELAAEDPVTHRLRKPPTIENAASCYQKLTGMSAAKFLEVSHSFSVDMKMRAADAQIMAMEVPGTPCIVVNGKYRVVTDVHSSVRSYDDLISVVRYLVAKESGH